MPAPSVLACPSPNRGIRRGGGRPRMVVIHYTGMDSAQAALERLCDPGSEVSAHYLIGRDGRIWQLVDEADRAWHAGRGSWGGEDDVNSRSIGIELDNPGPLAGLPPFPEALMVALETLLAGILERYAIPPEAVIGHADMAPGRKADPGPKFDWRRLALGGFSVWPGMRAPGRQGFAELAARAGYPVADAGEAAVLAAFRTRFRPGASGPPQPADLAVIADLAARWPAADA